MIRTVMRVSWLRLRRDRMAQALAFVVPVGFFTVFAAVFSGAGDQLGRRVVAVVDEDRSEASQRFVDALARVPGLDLLPAPPSLTRHQALELVARGDVPVAVVVRPGFGDGLGAGLVPDGDAGDGDGAAARAGPGPRAAVDILADTSDPVAPQLVAGHVQRTALGILPGTLVARLARAPTDVDTDTDTAQLATPTAKPPTQSVAGLRWLARLATAAGPDGLVDVEVQDLLARGTPGKSPVNAFYAAAIAVLFLLFSTTSTAGALLEEEHNGTLERLLVSRLTMGRLLLGRWLFAMLLGLGQLAVMFLWGALAFDVDLFTPRHLAGFAVMSVVTAAAAAAFGLVLATLCRTRTQLDGIGTMVILIMSAVGGSMFPRFLMPGWMQQAGLATFNAWALDGYQKVFWYEREVADLWPQLTVLAALTAVFLLAARVLARRWETG